MLDRDMKNYRNKFDIAKKNFRQLGGQFDEDNKRETVEQDSQKY